SFKFCCAAGGVTDGISKEFRLGIGYVLAVEELVPGVPRINSSSQRGLKKYTERHRYHHMLFVESFDLPDRGGYLRHAARIETFVVCETHKPSHIFSVLIL